MKPGIRDTHQAAAAACRPSGTFDPDVLKSLYGLHEAIVEITQVAMQKGYQPPASFDFHANVIAWAIEWEPLYCSRVESGEWLEDNWIEFTETFALEKLADVRKDCTNWG